MEKVNLEKILAQEFLSLLYFAMDDIQRKLALIDQQLTGRNLHKQIISTCPLVFVAVGLIAGILIQHTLLGPRATGAKLSESGDFAKFLYRDAKQGTS